MVVVIRYLLTISLYLIFMNFMRRLLGQPLFYLFELNYLIIFSIFYTYCYCN